MKKSFVLFSLISLISLSSVVYAMTLGVTPPENYIKNLKSCTKGVAVNNSTVYETYTVKGLLPDGRCEVQIVSYTNFANKKVYDEFKSLYSSFYKDGKVPSQAEMIEKGRQDKDIMTCKFTQTQRDALYKAYYQSLGHKQPGGCTKTADGGTHCEYEISGSSMSPYDNLLMRYSAGTCQ